ncbi:MAG: class I SAM-dependent methyltransferase [Planctomycetota bacterium]
MPISTDPFFEPYDREQTAYGEEPSAPLAEYLAQVEGSGKAFDLAAGAGRDSMELLRSGFEVTAVDLSERGLQKIGQKASEAGFKDRLTTKFMDVRDVVFPTGTLAGLVATTMLDHIPSNDALVIWQRMCDSLTTDGFMYVEVHTTEDPGCPIEPGCSSDAPVSETTGAVVNYFAPNQLAEWATRQESRLRILLYEERLEWDYTHGPEHQHGKAILLAVRSGCHPSWHGQPPAFPRRGR